MNWKEEIRKTIYRELPQKEKDVMDAGNRVAYSKILSDEPIWEKTVRAVIDEEETVLFSKENESADMREDTHGAAYDNAEDRPDENVYDALPDRDALDARKTERDEHHLDTEKVNDPGGEDGEAEGAVCGDPVGKADKENRIDDARQWLFKENLRLEGLRGELAKASRMMQDEADKLKADQERLKSDREKFEAEKEEFKKEMHQLNSEIRQSRKRLSEEKGLFEKKYKILEMGFAKLNDDKKELESQKRAFEYKKRFFYESDDFATLGGSSGQPVYSQDIFFFKGANHPLAIKKRYKELIKIYHPDNTDGDKNILQRINMEYDRLRRSMQ